MPTANLAMRIWRSDSLEQQDETAGATSGDEAMEPTKTVTINVDGKTYSGEYFVTLSGLTVLHSDYGNAVSHAASFDHDDAAATLLRELVERKKTL